MSRQLLINNANAVPAADDALVDPSEVDEARVAAFNADDFSAGSLDLTAPVPEDVENIIFVQGAYEDEEPLMSPVFSIDDIKRTQVHNRDYEAPVNQVTTVTPEEGTGVAYVRVVQVNTGFKPHKRVTVETVIDGLTPAEIAEDLANKINKAKPSFVSAEESAGTLVITGDNEVSFETSTDEEAAGWDVDATTTPIFGSGTPAHIANLEEIAFGANYINRIYLPTTPPSYAENRNYDLFTIQVPTNTTANISKSNKYHELSLAVETAATGIDLEEFFFGEEETT